MPVEIAPLYHAAFGTEPYPYQVCLAEDLWPDILDVPTGLGKTAAVLLAWICKRINRDAGTPPPAACLVPAHARVVEQTFALAQQCCQALQTSTQLDAFRDLFGTIFPCRPLWISATMNEG